MKQNIWFGLRATMLAAILSSAPSTQAQQDFTPQGTKDHANGPVSTNISSTVNVDVTSPTANPQASTPSTPAKGIETQVVKLGTRYIPTTANPSSEAVLAKIQVHEWNQRQAATLYLRNIPVLTFLGRALTTTEPVKVGVTAPPASKETLSQGSAIASPASTQDSDTVILATATSSEADDPVSRATKVAAQLNQAASSSTDLGEFTIHWVGKANSTQERYEIRVGNKTLVTLDQNVLLAGQQKQSESFALQATNRMRRLVSNATPLTEVAGKPKPQSDATQQVALGPVRFTLNGMASWYGPGFHGNLSANGEIYNQYAMTAAHKSLPFGTRVRVTNLDNGRSVIVRINDRGPYVGDRIIDLSMGAAELIGMMGSGVAPVRVDILN